MLHRCSNVSLSNDAKPSRCLPYETLWLRVLIYGLDFSLCQSTVKQHHIANRSADRFNPGRNRREMFLISRPVFVKKKQKTKTKNKTTKKQQQKKKQFPTLFILQYLKIFIKLNFLSCLFLVLGTRLNVYMCILYLVFSLLKTSIPVAWKYRDCEKI